MPQCRQKKNIVKEMNQKQLEVLREMSSWCLQDLGSKSNRTKVSSELEEESFVTSSCMGNNDPSAAKC